MFCSVRFHLLAGMVAAWVSLGNATAVLVVESPSGSGRREDGDVPEVCASLVPIIFTGMLLPMAWLWRAPGSLRRPCQWRPSRNFS